MMSRDASRTKTIKPLPDTYTTVPPAAFQNDNPSPLKTNSCVIPESILTESGEIQVRWLKVYELLQKDDLDTADNISWSAHFASV